MCVYVVSSSPLALFVCRLHDWAFFSMHPFADGGGGGDVSIDESTGERQGADISEEELERWIDDNWAFYKEE